MKSHPAPRTIARIPMDNITANPHQPRQIFQEDSIAELAESIRIHGLLSPLLVRRVGAGQFELIAGERRLRALKLLGRDHAEAIVLTAYDQDSALMALVENLQRENLHYLDEAEAYRGILDSHPITQDRLAQTLCLSPSALANRLRLMKLSPAVRDYLQNTELSERHARALLSISDPNLQLDMAKLAHVQNLTVRQLEKRITDMSKKLHPLPHCAARDIRLYVNAITGVLEKLRAAGARAESTVTHGPDGVEICIKLKNL